MRRVIVDSLISLDGYFAGPHDEIDWFVMDRESYAWSRAILRRVDTFLFGRVTYEGMAAYWSEATDDDPYITRRLNDSPKIVFSRTLAKANWANSRVERGDPAGVVAELKKGSGKAMVVLGSSHLVSTLVREGLVDEYRIRVQPIILGAGRPLFKDQSRRSELKLITAKAFRSGVVGLHYEPMRVATTSSLPRFP